MLFRSPEHAAPGVDHVRRRIERLELLLAGETEDPAQAIDVADLDGVGRAAGSGQQPTATTATSQSSQDSFPMGVLAPGNHAQARKSEEPEDRLRGFRYRVDRPEACGQR